MLVPEINLTPQLFARVHAASPGLRVATLHSGLGRSERRAEWLAAASGAAQLVLGTRLAVFAPTAGARTHRRRRGTRRVVQAAGQRALSRPRCRHLARPAAGRSRRARQRDPFARIVAARTRAALPAPRASAARGSARCAAASHPRPATAPRVRSTASARRCARPSPRRLARGEQSLVFVNRRGFAPSLICARADGKRNARAAARGSPRIASRRHCAAIIADTRSACRGMPVMRECRPGAARLRHAAARARAGGGVSRRAHRTRRSRQYAREERFAACATRSRRTRSTSWSARRCWRRDTTFRASTLVGVLGADNALYSADFRATERLAALLMQVAGRAGRAGLPGEVIVQTDFPEHPVYAALAHARLRHFAESLLAERRGRAIAAVHACRAARRRSAPARRCRRVPARCARGGHRARGGRRTRRSRCSLPVPALLSRRAGFERGQIVVQSARRSALQRFLAAWRGALAALPGRRARWVLDVDPAGFG